jgi:hypothetical protein
MVVGLQNGNQAVSEGVLRPEPRYSRIIVVQPYQKLPAVEAFGISPYIGNACVLRHIKVMFSPRYEVAPDSWFWGVNYGRGIPGSVAECRLWTPLMPVFTAGGRDDYISYYYMSPIFDIDVHQKFTAQELRFGAWFITGGTIAVMYMYAFFEISEG